MESTLAAARSRRADDRAVLGRHRARRAARAGVRRVRRSGACRRGRCARTAGRSTSRGCRRAGAGRVWSFIVPHPPLLPAYAEVAPYNAIVVELDEDPTIRFVGNLVASADGAINEIDPATIEIGEPVRVVFAPDRRRLPPPLGARVKDTYPLVPEGVDDYPIKVGSMLLTLVDPHRGLRGRVQPLVRARSLLRGLHDRPVPVRGQPLGRDARAQGSPLADRRGDGRAARPTPARTSRSTSSSAAITSDHFDDWARPQVNALYADGRGFAERRHVHTVLFDHLGAAYRDDDPVPIELALDHGYDGDRARLVRRRSTATPPRCTRARGAATARSARRLRRSRSRARGRRRPARTNRATSRWTSAARPAAPNACCRCASCGATSATRSRRCARTPTRVEPRPVWRRHASSRRSSAPSSAPTPTSTTSGNCARLCQWRVAVAMRICARGRGCRGAQTLRLGGSAAVRGRT